MLKYFPIGVFVLTAAIPCRSAAQQPVQSSTIPTAREDADALKGLKGFDVVTDINSTRADSVAMRNRIELKLRQNGIRVGADETPFLRVSCVALDKEPGVVAYTCSIQVVQSVVRSFPTMLRLSATTWRSTEHVATVGSDNLREAMLSKIDRLCDEFLNEWYKANPR